MSIVAVHGPNTFGSKAVTEVGPAMATVNPANGLIWTFRLDQASTRTTSLVWTFPTGTPASATGPGPHTVTFGSAGTKAVTAVATGTGEGANPYPPAGTTNLPITAIAGTAPQTGLMSAPPEEGGGEEPPPAEEAHVDVAFDPAAHTIADVMEFVRANPDQAREMLDAERAGQARVTLIAQLEEMTFDPADYTVTQVIGYVEDHPDKLEDVIAAEQAGRNRSTLITQLESMRPA